MDLDNLDKKLVQSGSLLFRKNDTQNHKNLFKEYKLTDDGMIELYENNNLISIAPFAKLTLTRNVKTIVQEGYDYEDISKVEEAEVSKQSKDAVDLEQEKQDLEDQIKQADEVKVLKDELDKKVDELFEESIDTESNSKEKDNLQHTIDIVDRRKIEGMFPKEIEQEQADDAIQRLEKLLDTAGWQYEIEDKDARIPSYMITKNIDGQNYSYSFNIWSNIWTNN